jgi:pimeloyl-ACP methyl ester carboxylesterase
VTFHRFERHGVTLRYHDDGGSLPPVVFQHGLGGSEAQTAECFPPDAGVRRVTLECRAHGGSDPDPAHRYSIAAFADDVLALCDALRIDRFVAGGISMGAAIALRIATRYPERVRGLILVRPAFLFDPAPPNMRPNALVADCLASNPPGEARGRFMATDAAKELAREAPDNLASLAGFLDRGPSPALAELLRRIANGDPGVGREQAGALRIPTLVVGNGVDRIHPPEMARELAATIPGARLAQVTPKARDRAAHLAEVGAAIRAFLHALPEERTPP